MRRALILPLVKRINLNQNMKVYLVNDAYQYMMSASFVSSAWLCDIWLGGVVQELVSIDLTIVHNEIRFVVRLQNNMQYVFSTV